MKLLKFFNFLAYKREFMNVSGYNMSKFVMRISSLKKPFRKILYSQGNLHDRVVKLRHELDEVQKALNKNQPSFGLRDEESIYLTAFMQATFDEERQDNVLYKGNSVPKVFVDHYMQFLGIEAHVTNLEHQALFRHKLNHSKAENMVHVISNDEVRMAMFSIGNDKASGPDGYTSFSLKKLGCRGWRCV
nr:hypothetical protein [Tanacetum cinerariifolium]